MTGASGFLGAQLCELLEQRGYAVTRIVGRSAAIQRSVYQADLSQPGGWMDLFIGDAVIFHLAGKASVPDSVANPLVSKTYNLDTTIQVLETARQVGARVVLASTGAVYADSLEPWDEAAATAPRSPYAAAKLAGEQFACAYAASYGMSIWTARLFSVYGPRMRGMAMRDFVRRLHLDPSRLQIRGDGKQVRDYIHVRDAARALIALAEDAPIGIYNVASGTDTTVAELAASVAQACGYPDCRIEPDGVNPAGEPQAMRANVSKLRSIGFQPTMTFEQGLTETVGWLQTGIKESKGDES